MSMSPMPHAVAVVAALGLLLMAADPLAAETAPKPEAEPQAVPAAPDKQTAPMTRTPVWRAGRPASCSPPSTAS